MATRQHPRAELEPASLTPEPKPTPFPPKTQFTNISLSFAFTYFEPVGMPKSKAYSNPLPSVADENRYATKCHELRARIRDIERENLSTQLKILQSKKNVSRLRIERAVLYEALAAITASAAKAADLTVPSQAQPSGSNQPPTATSTPNPNPAATVPSPHNGYHHPQSIRPPNRAYNEPVPTPNNNHGQLPPNRNFSRSTEPIPINGLSGLLNSNNNNNSHHGPPPPIPHSQYPQNLPLQTQVQSHNNNNPRMTGNAHQLAPISGDPTTSARSPTTANNHFPHHQLNARSMSVSTHHHHNRYPSPHHHHHHHHHRHPSEHVHSNNPTTTAVLPSLRPHPPASSQSLSNGNGTVPVSRVPQGRPDVRESHPHTNNNHHNNEEEEEVGEEEDGEEEIEEDEEEEEEDEGEGSVKDGSNSMVIMNRQLDDEMEIDAEGEDDG
ncbi:hypothetical protein MJO29_015183 [Puccinia striiformis f. sp. tritici]|nr:hypothetical protein MJO29_015183 [Puccinia striiformis f. sp. tritici]